MSYYNLLLYINHLKFFAMKNRTSYWTTLLCLLVALGGTAQNVPGYVPGAPLPCRAHEQIQRYFEENPTA